MKATVFLNLTARLLGGAFLLTVGTGVLAQIQGTKHDLSGRAGSGTNEICVFCHTPHAANLGSVVPLWNRALRPDQTYQTYADLGTTTLDAQTTQRVGSVSLACLSCHDGVQAMDNLINQPGSGGFSAAGATLGNLGRMPTTSVAMVDTDLRNDHPIGIQYCGGGIDSNNAAATVEARCRDKDFVDTDTAEINGTRVWWVETPRGTANVRDKSDMMLYTRPTAALTSAVDETSAPNRTGAVEPFVECGSCHDPHSRNATFLRVENTGSAVCLACHAK